MKHKKHADLIETSRPEVDNKRVKGGKLISDTSKVKNKTHDGYNKHIYIYLN